MKNQVKEHQTSSGVSAKSERQLRGLEAELATHGNICTCAHKKMCEDREVWLIVEIGRLKGLHNVKSEFWESAEKDVDVLTAAPQEVVDVEADELPAVGGRRLAEWTLADFERNCRVLLRDEQGKPNCDTRIVSVLCNAVRLAREQCDTARQPITLPNLKDFEHE